MALGIEESIVWTQGGTTEVSRLAGESVSPLGSGRWLDIQDVEIVIHNIDDGVIAGPPAEMAEIKQILTRKKCP